MLGSDFYTPIVYQDLANSSMPPMNLSFGQMTGSYLGNVKMRSQLDADKVDIMNRKESQDKSTFKKAMLALAAIGVIAILPSTFKKLGRFLGFSKKTSLFTKLKNGLYNITVRPVKSIIKGCKNLFGKKKSTSTTTP